MQSLKMITNVLPQDIDLQSKDNLEVSYDCDEKASFSHLVNQHVASEKRLSDNTKQTNVDDELSSVSRKILATSQYNEQQDTDQVNASSDVNENIHLIRNTEEVSLEESEVFNSDTPHEDGVFQESDTAQIVTANTQNTPEQFMTLLYASDNTLTSSTSIPDSLSTEADRIVNKHLSEVDVATANPLKTSHLSTKIAEPLSAVDLHINVSKLSKVDSQQNSVSDNEFISFNKVIDELSEGSSDKKSSYSPTKEYLVFKDQFNGKTQINVNEAKFQPTLKTLNVEGTDSEVLVDNELLNKDKKVMLGDLVEQTLAIKLPKEQGSQTALKNLDLRDSNKVLSGSVNQVSVNQVSVAQNAEQLSQQRGADAIDDSLLLHTANSKVDSKVEAVIKAQNNNDLVDIKSKNSQRQNLPKELALNNKTTTDSSFYHLSQPITETSQQSNVVAEKTLNRREILPQHIIKNVVEQNQLIVTNEEHLKVSMEDTPFLDTDNAFTMTEKPITTKPIHTFSDTFNTRFAQEAQFQTNQSLQSKQTSEAYLTHQMSEVLHHNVAIDTAHIQKNNVQLQQETIAIFRKDFADAVKDKVLVMINQKLQKFEITLDPPEFGNMQVRVNLQGEQASVNFVVQNQQAKEALEQNMHKLKDMLADQGVDVGGANVEQQSQGEKNAQGGKMLDGELINSTLVSEGESQQVFSASMSDSSTTAIDYYA